MTNQPLRADESQNTRNVPLWWGKNPAVHQVRTQTVGNVIDTVEQKENTSGEIQSVENILNDLTVSHDISEILSHNVNIQKISENFVKSLFDHDAYVTNIIREENRIRVVLDPTQQNSHHWEILFSLDTQGTLWIDGKFGTLFKPNGYMCQAHEHDKERFVRWKFSRDTWTNKNYWKGDIAPLQDIFYDKQSVGEAIRNSYHTLLADFNTTNLRVKKITRNGKGMIVDTIRPISSKKSIWWHRTKHTSQKWQIDRDQKWELRVKRLDTTTPYDAVSLHIPHAERSDLDMIYKAPGTKNLPEYLENLNRAQKVTEDILKEAFPDIPWKITKIRKNTEYPSIYIDIEGLSQKDSTWMIYRNRIGELILNIPDEPSDSFPIILPKT